MKLSWIEAFCTAVEERSISAAARRMYLSQPGLSERIAELEQEAGTALLLRSRHGVTPTESGAEFYEKARPVLQSIRELESELAGMRGQRESVLRFGAGYTLGEHLVLNWLRDFDADVADPVIELVLGTNREIVDQVRRRRIAFGIVARQGDLSGLDTSPLLTDTLVVVVPTDHPWTTRYVTVGQLHEEPYIAREPGSGTRDLTDAIVREAGASPLRVAMQLRSVTAVKAAVQAELGFAIVSRYSVQRELDNGQLAVVDGFNVSREWVLVRREGDTLSPLERGLHDHFQIVAANV